MLFAHRLLKPVENPIECCRLLMQKSIGKASWLNRAARTSFWIYVASTCDLPHILLSFVPHSLIYFIVHDDSCICLGSQTLTYITLDLLVVQVRISACSTSNRFKVERTAVRSRLGADEAPPPPPPPLFSLPILRRTWCPL